MICKNCGTYLDTNFCGNCGQNSKVKKINLKYILQDIPDSVLLLNSGFLFTLRELTLRPAEMIKEFLAGKRKPHYKPLAFFLLTSTSYFLLFYLLDKNTFIEDFLTGFKSGLDKDSESPAFLEWILRNQSYFLLAFLPLFSLGSYLAFKKCSYSYLEHLVMNLYITGFQMIIYLILGFVIYSQNLLLLIPFIVGFIYNVWIINRIFNNIPLWNKLVRLALSYIIFFTLVIVLASTVIIISGLVNKWF